MGSRLRHFLRLFAASALAVAAVPASAGRYQAIVFDADAIAHAVNNNGVIVGESWASGAPRAAVWRLSADQTQVNVQLLPPGNIDSAALAVSDKFVAGWQNVGGKKEAVYWDIIGSSSGTYNYYGPYALLPSLTGYDESWATGINNDRLAVGVFVDASSKKPHAGYWSREIVGNGDGTTQEIPSVALFAEPDQTMASEALSMETGTYAAGYADNGTWAGHLPILWNAFPGENQEPMIPLATPGGDPGVVEHINKGRMVGWYDSANDAGAPMPRALSWERGQKDQYLELGALDGSASKALRGNLRGEIVGWAGDADPATHKAFLFEFGCGQQDLNDLLIPSSAQQWQLKEAHLIGEKDGGGNWILGSGERSGVPAKYVLLPADNLNVDLAIAMTADQENINVGQPNTYRISVTNKTTPTVGNDGYATCVRVVDILPPGMSHVSTKITKGSCFYRNPMVTCIINRLDSGATVEMELRVEARPILADRVATNTVVVSATETELDNDDNTAEHTTAVARNGCFIATAAFGSYLDPHVQVLRDFRDAYLLTNTAGTRLVELYYHHSPPIASYIQDHEWLRLMVRVSLTPLVYAFKFPGTAAASLLILFALSLRRVYNRRALRMRS